MKDKKEEDKDTIPKKTAALEMYKQSKKSYIIALVSIFGLLMSVGTYVIHRLIGAGIAALVCGILAMAIYKNVKFCNYLNERYSLGFNKIEVKDNWK